MIITFDDGTKIRINEKQEDWELRIAKGSNGKWKGIEFENRADGKGKSIDILNVGPEIGTQLAPFGISPSGADR